AKHEPRAELYAVEGEIGAGNHGALPALPRRDDLDPVTVLHRRQSARSRRHELAIERGRNLSLAEVERFPRLRTSRGRNPLRFAGDDEPHTSAPNRWNASVVARSANAGA